MNSLQVSLDHHLSAVTRSTRPARIALVTPEYPPYVRGGTGTSANLLANNLRDAGLSVDVYVLENKEEEYTERGDKVYFMRGLIKSDPYYAIWSLKAPILANQFKQYDLIHVYGSTLMPSLALVHYLLRHIPIIFHLNFDSPACLYSPVWKNDPTVCCTLSKQFQCAQARLGLTSYASHSKLIAPFFYTGLVLQRYISQQMSHMLSLSHTLKDLYVSHGFREDRIHVVGSPYDPKFEQQLALASHTRSDKEMIVMYAGRLNAEKNVQELIHAFAKVQQTEAKLWIVGRGVELENLQRLATELDLADRVRFWGHKPYNDLAPLYAQADIFVHPGLWAEPFGRTCLEAMLAKMAIVVSNVGAPPEILGDAGLVYPVGDIEELSQLLTRLIQNKNLRVRLGIKAKERVHRHYSPASVTKKILQVYPQLGGSQ